MHLVTIIGGAGAIQGAVILVSILLRFRHRKNLPLALLILVFSVRMATIPTWSEQVLLRFPWLFPLTAPLPVLFAPLLWWYVRESASHTPARPPCFILHWIPFVLLVAFLSGITASMDSTHYKSFVASLFSGKPPVWFTVQNGVKVVINSVYMVLAARIAFGNGTKLLSRQKRFWLRTLVILPTIVFGFYCYVALNPAATALSSAGNTLPFCILAITMLVFVYLVAFLFMFTPNFSIIPYAKTDKTREPRYTDAECQAIMARVNQELDKGIFKNPDLTISDLATLLEIHPNKLSFVINHCTSMSFRTLLNTKRIEFFCRQVSTGSLHNHSILRLALEAGFPSKSTFNRVFSEHTGMSPSEYLKNHTF